MSETSWGGGEPQEQADEHDADQSSGESCAFLSSLTLFADPGASLGRNVARRMMSAGAPSETSASPALGDVEQDAVPVRSVPFDKEWPALRDMLSSASPHRRRCQRRDASRLFLVEATYS